MQKIYYIGLDTHKESIAIAIAEEGGEALWSPLSSETRRT